MSGEDRQQFARDSFARMSDFTTTAKSYERDGNRKEGKKWRMLAHMELTKVIRYDDAGEFSYLIDNT